MNSIRQHLPVSTQRQLGFSMVEILVALTISTFLIAGVIQLFIGSKQAYRFHDAASRLQENGRLAIDTMARDIRMAGYQVPQSNAISDTNNVITVRWNDNGLQTRAYSIGARTAGGAATCPSAATSLFLQRQTDATRQELIEGVQAMQILYGVCSGVDTTIPPDGVNDVNVVNPPYVNAAGVAANWANVCSVRIHLLLVNLENNIVTEPQTVFFPPDGNTQFAVNDRCLRQTFSTTIAIRNRLTP